MRKIAAFLVVWIGWTYCQAEVAVPPDLEPWRQWVLHDHPEAPCPFLHNEAKRSCVWPSRLVVDAGAAEGRFVFDVELFAPGWVTLPGDDSLWPRDVQSGGKALAVSSRDGRPAVYLPPGEYQLSGRWLWDQAPRTLAVPAEAGLLQVSLNGRPLDPVHMPEAGQLWLAEPPKDEQAAASKDALAIKVFRRLEDGNPMVVETWVQLDVSGSEREIRTGPLLLKDFVPRSFDSNLPARVEADGSLRVQLKPGRWDLRLRAHHNRSLEQLSYQPRDNLWPTEELWVFDAAPQLRTVQVEGVPAIDASQTPLPPEWQGLPTYLLTPSTPFTLNVLHRGDPNPPQNQLTLNKQLWLDFGGEGYTVKDEITGSLHQKWRLEVTEPYQLGRVELQGEPRLITRLSGSGAAGVELRESTIALTALSQLPEASPLPVSGWDTTFDQVEQTWHLPPGWSVLHISGADSVNGAWLDRWNLWNLFLVLLIAVSMARVTHPGIGAVALITLLLTFQRSGAPVFAWLNIVVALAVLPYVSGRVVVWVRTYTLIGFALLALILLPFVVQQVRQAVYPQLAEVSAYAGSGAAPSPVSQAADLVEEVQVYGVREESISKPKFSASRAAPAAPRLADLYDPAQKVQVGPGLPEWQWHSVYARWSGPVQAGEATRVVLVAPLLNRLGSLLSAVLPCLLASLLLRCFLRRHRFEPKQILLGNPVAALLLVGVIALPEVGKADVLIDQALLKTLEERLLAPPKCLPSCAALEAVELTLSDDRLQLALQVHAAADIALPLPVVASDWWLSGARVGEAAVPVLIRRGGELYVYLPSGEHHLVLTGNLRGRDSLTLNFGLPLHNLTQQVTGWQLSGAPGANQTSQTLQLRRQERSSEQANRLLPDPIPAYVTVTRHLQLGLEWRVQTEVRRVAPANGVIHLAVPLLPGEAPLSGQRTPDGGMDVRFGPEQAVVSWQSRLQPTAEITLQAPVDVPWAEVWMLETSPVWHTDYQGLPPVQETVSDGQPSAARPNAARPNAARPLWQPWPGEQLTITVARPEAVAGSHRVIDNVRLHQQFGRRATDTTLSLRIRATYGEPYALAVPEGAELKQLLIDGAERPISHSQNRLQIPIKPGAQQVEVQWQTPTGIALREVTPQLDLETPAANIQLQMALPPSRWPLLVGGPSLGPAVLFWGVLAVVLAAAVVLGRSRLTPVKAWEWVLLSLGVATVNLYLLALVAVWFMVLQRRGRLTTAPQTGTFNAVQMLLFLFSFIALGALVASIPYSLLAAPQMYITGNGSGPHFLQWYHDQTGGTLPTAWVVSVPLWVYRLIMLVWSIWLAFTLVKWVRWGWQQLGVQGYWHTLHTANKPATENEVTPKS